MENERNEAQVDFEKAFRILELYYNEWKYRLDNVRKHTIQVYSVILITTTLPLTIGIFNGIKLPESIPTYCFPTVGILFTVIAAWYFNAEAKRIRLLDDKIHLIISNYFPKDYRKEYIGRTSSLKTPKTEWITITLGLVELLLAVYILYLSYSGKFI